MRGKSDLKSIAKHTKGDSDVALLLLNNYLGMELLLFVLCSVFGVEFGCVLQHKSIATVYHRLPAPIWRSVYDIGYWVVRYWVRISVPAPTQIGFLKALWEGVRPIDPLLSH